MSRDTNEYVRRSLSHKLDKDVAIGINERAAEGETAKERFFDISDVRGSWTRHLFIQTGNGGIERITT